MCRRFALKCLKYEKTKKLFPINSKQHKMSTKKTENFYVKNAKTERLKESAIPNMQRLLNNESKKTVNK